MPVMVFPHLADDVSVRKNLLRIGLCYGYGIGLQELVGVPGNPSDREHFQKVRIDHRDPSVMDRRLSHLSPASQV